MRSIVNKVKEITGVYGLGFDRDSFLGIALPVGAVLAIGGLGALINVLFLS